jgi:3-hydroxymyristoyl/3-hydroxydecanoyl-(acyl carrier protein) dehydratase
MLINQSAVKTIIPQREPFIMIDHLLRADDSGFSTSFEIKEDNVFFENGTVSSSAIIENIAQTCAAGFGYLGSQAGEGKAKLGFIGAISKLTVSGTANLSDTVETNVTILNSFENIHLVEGVATVNGEPIVSCQMKIVQA